MTTSVEVGSTSTTIVSTAISTTTINPYLENSYDSVWAALKINSILLIFFLILFDVLVRVRWQTIRQTLLPKLRDGDEPPCFLSWVRLKSGLVWDSGMNDLPPTADRDVVLRFCMLGFKFSVVGSLICIPLLILYYNGKGEAEGFSVWSISNLGHESAGFWGVVVAAYILSGVLMRFLLTEWRVFVKSRRDHFNQSCLSKHGAMLAQTRRTVLVETIPPEYQSEEKVRLFFEECFGDGSVHSCTLMKDTTDIYRRLDISEKVFCCCCCLKRQVEALGDAVDRVGGRVGEIVRRDIDRDVAVLPTTRSAEDAASPLARAPASAIAAAPLGTMAELGQGARNLAVGVVQFAQVATFGIGVSSTAVVTFWKAVDCAKATQLLLVQGDETHVGTWRVTAAPEPQDVVWRNIHKPYVQNRLRTYIVRLVLVIGVIFWAAPVAFVQGIAQVSSLKEQLPGFVKFLEENPALYSVVTAYLPALALIGLQAILPYLFDFLARWWEGTKSESAIEVKVLSRCFYYNLVSLYVTVCFGSVFQALENILKSPTEILNLLANELPGVSVYFITFVLAKVGLSLPLWLLIRPLAPLFGNPQVCAFGYELANLSLVLVLGLTYSFISPMILPACALFFGLATLIYRFLFEHVYEPRFDSGGIMWYTLFNCVMVGFFIGTLALFAITWASSRIEIAQLVILGFLPIMVGVFYNYIWRHIGNESLRLALKDTMAVDEASEGAHFYQEFDRKAYVDPILKLQEARASDEFHSLSFRSNSDRA